VIGSVLGHFRIEGKLGAGGMGEVYLARDLRLERQVALKFIHPALAADPEVRRRFEREARALAALDHPYVGTVYGVEEAEGQLFIVLAYIEGRSLDSILTEGPLPAGRAHALLTHVAEGLHAAHRRGIVHRDIKSANVMVGEDDVPKIVDFGIALRVGETRLTQTGVHAGTPGFTAPEVFRGEPADARSDVFSLGVVCYEALTGRLPFERESPAAAMHAVLNEDPPPFPRDLPPELLALEPVVRRCLSKEPADRFPDAGALAKALHARAVTGHAPAGGSSQRHYPWGRVAAAGAVVALAALASWLVIQRGAAPREAAGSAPGKRSVAVLEFENVTRDPSLDWMKRGVAELLSAALIQSPTLDVFDAQRLGDLAASGRPSTPPSPPTYGFLARHGIRRAVAGSILRSGGDLCIEGRIVETDGGRLVRSCTVTGPADSSLFHLVGRLIPDLQVALEVNLTGNREAEGWLREITTTSADAYRAYLRGHEALLASRWYEAASAYEQALALDSTFIAARTELSGAYWNLGDDEKLQLTRAAMRRLRSRADHRGQLRIDLLESVVGEDAPGLVRAASALVQLYPENRFYTYLLGRGYYYTKQYRRCLDTLRPLADQRYGWAWTYVLSARSAARLGDTATAQRMFERGLEVTRADPELAYAYVRFLRSRGDRERSRVAIEEGLRSPALAESPVAEGELRLELAKDLATRREAVRAREELRRADALIPRGDEARPEADSLLRRFGLR
jgi:serine/threonine-protein kinase